MSWVLADRARQDHLGFGIDGNNDLQKPLPLSCRSSAVVGACIGSLDSPEGFRAAVGIDAPLSGKSRQRAVSGSAVTRASILGADTSAEGGEVREFVQLKDLQDCIHHYDQFDESPIIQAKMLFQKEKYHQLVLGVGFL